MCIVVANGAKNVTALPGTALSSKSSIGMRSKKAAMQTGKDTSPPVLIIFFGLCLIRKRKLFTKERGKLNISIGYRKMARLCSFPSGSCMPKYCCGFIL